MTKKTILFPGKFQPPHIGHILTINKLLSECDKLILGVTEGNLVLSSSTVAGIFSAAIPSSKLEIRIIEGSIENGTATIDFDFDEVRSGNPRVIEYFENAGILAVLEPRSHDTIFQGTSIRNAFANTIISKQPPIMETKIVPLDKLKPIEKIQSSHYSSLKEAIHDDGVIRKPLIVDKETYAVLDGSHRYAFLLQDGYLAAPVVLCDYDNESIFVGNHLKHRFENDETKWISKSLVRQHAVSGALFPARTTRHFFPFRKVDWPISLLDLPKGPKREITHLISPVTAADEVANNNSYIEEIDVEISLVSEYISEQTETRNWLKNQNQNILKNKNLTQELKQDYDGKKAK